MSIKKFFSIPPLFILAVIVCNAYLSLFLFSPLQLGARKFILGSDYRAFYTAAQMLKNGAADLYTPSVQFHWQRTYVPEVKTLAQLNPFRNPPLIASLFVPLTFLSFEWGYVALLFINILLFGLVVHLIFKLLPLHSLKERGYVLLMSLGFNPVLFVFGQGQTSLLIVIALLLSRLLSVRKHSYLAGVALSLVAVKPQYLPLLLIFLLFQKNLKTLAGFFAGLIGVLCLSVILVGYADIIGYINFLVNTLGQWDRFTIQPRMMFTLQSLWLNIARSDVIDSVRWFWYGSITIVTGVFMWASYRRTDKAPWMQEIQWAILPVALVLTSPYTNIQDLSVLIVTAVSLVRWSAIVKDYSYRAARRIITTGFVLGNALWAALMLYVAPLYILFLLGVFLYLTTRLRFQSNN
ncbi:MAG: glycosyltransferase family 87 protein [Patescibacteria group bacterium]|jgi:hypothetical protein